MNGWGGTPEDFMADFSFACPSCKQVLEASDDMAGQVVECPACQQQITIPCPETAAPQEEVAAPQDAEEAPASPKCPSCGTAMEADAVLCVHCGFHTKLGKKINTSFG